MISRATISITTFHTTITNPFFLVATLDEIFKSVLLESSHKNFCVYESIIGHQEENLKCP